MTTIKIGELTYTLPRKDILEKIDQAKLIEAVFLTSIENDNFVFYTDIFKEKVDNNYCLLLKGVDSSTGEDIVRIVYTFN